MPKHLAARHKYILPSSLADATNVPEARNKACQKRTVRSPDTLASFDPSRIREGEGENSFVGVAV